MYRDFLEAGYEGLQHVAYWTESFERDLAQSLDAGFSIGQSGQVGADGRFVYFESTGHPGTVMELSEISGEKGRLFTRIREAAASWDGSKPIHRR